MKNRPHGKPGAKNRQPNKGFVSPHRRADSPQKKGEVGAARADGKKAFKSSVKDSKPRPSPTRSAQQTQPRKPQIQGQLLWGLHAVREAWLNPARKCSRLWLTESGQIAMAEVLEQAAAQKLDRPTPARAQRVELDHLTPPGSVHQGIVLEASPLREMSLDDLLGLDEDARLVVVLDQVTDPHNVGAILRSAAAFGASAVIVTERNAPGATGVMAKSACGAAEHVPLIPVVNLARALEALKAESYWCVGLAEEGEKPLDAIKLGDGRIALVLGAEGDGLRRLTRQHCDELAHLPTQGPIGSLNVSNAAAIALYEAKRQFKA